MATNKLPVTGILTPEEYQQIDLFCSQNSNIKNSIQDLAVFLAEKFSLELITDFDIVTGFITDSSNLNGSAEAVCRPHSERECAVIFRACFKAGIPFTISAGRSNLTGSATPSSGIIISMVNMLSPNPKVNDNCLEVLSPVGIILEDLRNYILKQTEQKLIFPVDPTSRTDATLGGAIACNASGFMPGEIGSIRNWVKKIDFLFPNGLKVCAKKGEYISENGKFIIQTDMEREFPVPCYNRPALKNASGPYSSKDGKTDFVDLIIGSEGLFGLVTGCVLELQERPVDYLDIFFSFPEEKDALSFYQYLKNNLGGGFGSLSALEYFGVNCRKYMKHEKQLFARENQVGIYVQVPLFAKTIEDAAEEWLDIIIGSDSGIEEDDIILMDNERNRKIFLEARHSMPANALEVVQHRGTYTIMTDAVVPSDYFFKYLEYTHALIKSEGMDYLSFGHLGDCHLHFTILPEKKHLKRAAEIYDFIIAKAAQFGGVYSGEHGTGKRKCIDFIKCYGQSAVKDVKKSKAAVDPEFLLNRDNVVAY